MLDRYHVTSLKLSPNKSLIHCHTLSLALLLQFNQSPSIKINWQLPDTTADSCACGRHGL